MAVHCDVRSDGHTLVASPIGRLQLTDVVPLRDSLLKCLSRLLLVSSVADHWGWLPSEGGKVVWAALRREP